MEQTLSNGEAYPCQKNLDSLFTRVRDLSETLKNSEKEAITNNTALLNVNETRWRLKHILKQLMSYHEFLNQLRKEPEEWMTQKTISEKTQEIVDEYAKKKAEYNQMNENVTKLTCLLDEAEKICELKSSVEIELEEINKKKQKFEILKKRYDTKFEIFKDKCETNTEAMKLIEDQKKKIEEKMQLIEILKTEKQIEQNKAQDKSLLILMNLEKFFTTCDVEEEPRDSTKFGQALALAEELSGVKVKSQTASCHSLQISYGKNENKSQVYVDLHLAKQKPPHPTKIIDIKVNDCCVATDDITSKAISRNNFTEIIPELQMRFEKNRNLADEIEELRKLSAIDWIPGENTLVVIVGSRTCTLHVPDGYPNTGEIVLRDIKGFSVKQLESMKPLKLEPTLSDWVSYLENELDG